MKWMGVTASIIGVLFGVVGLVLTFMLVAGNALDNSHVWSNFPLFFGPLSLIVAAVVGWKSPRVSGWWLIGFGLAFAILARNIADPGHFMGEIVYPIVLPMLVAGALWLLRYSKLKGNLAA